MPAWFAYLVLIGCSGVLCFGGFGLLMGVIGHYSAAAALVLGAGGTAVCVFVGRPRWSGVPAGQVDVGAAGQVDLGPAGRPDLVSVGRAAQVSGGRAAQLPAAAMTVTAAVIGIWNAVFAGQHVAVDRDPGVYLIAGRWLAQHGSLVVPAGQVWAPVAKSTFLYSAGTYQMAGGQVQFQFAHLLPALLAEGFNLGGDSLMLRVPALLGAIALCAVYAAGTHLVRRGWVLFAAVAALGLSLPELSVTRDTYSEAATQILLWGGIWLLLRAYRERSVGVAVISGLMLGGTLMTRIDAVIYLVPLPLLAAVGWLAASERDRRRVAAVIAGVAVGVLPTAILGTIDIQKRSTVYYDDLHSDALALYAGLALGLIAAVALVVLWPRAGAARTWLVRRRATLAGVAAGVVGGGAVLAWALRPAGPKQMLSGPTAATIEALERLENLPVVPETFAEHSMQWIDWYVGPVSLALAIAGLCYLTSVIIRRGDPAGLVVLALTGPLTAYYLWNPSVTPEQIWAMRRFVPVSLPLLLLAAAVALEVGANVIGARLSRPAGRGVLAVGMAGMVAFPLGVTLPVGSFRPEANYLSLVKETCKDLGPNAAVLFPDQDFDGFALMQSMRDWCGIPAAGLFLPATQAKVRTMAADLASEGRALWVLGYSASSITSAVPGLEPGLIASAQSPHELTQTIARPADTYTQTPIFVYAARVAPG